MELVDKGRNSVKRSRISVSFASRKSPTSTHPDNLGSRDSVTSGPAGSDKCRNGGRRERPGQSHRLQRSACAEYGDMPPHDGFAQVYLDGPPRDARTGEPVDDARKASDDEDRRLQARAGTPTVAQRLAFRRLNPIKQTLAAYRHSSRKAQAVPQLVVTSPRVLLTVAEPSTAAPLERVSGSRFAETVVCETTVRGVRKGVSTIRTVIATSPCAAFVTRRRRVDPRQAGLESTRLVPACS